MKIKIGLAALAAGALALGLVAPGAATAAPKVEKPSGKALVRIDTGVAITKEQSKGSYRIVVPTGAFIGWMGEVAGKGPRIGNFSPKALVGAWATLGHSDSNRATATLTWVRKGETKPTFVAATLENPRISDAGKLTFIAKVERKLPKNMNDFTININRAAPTPRFPVPGALLYLDEYHQAQGWQTTEAGDGYVAWTGTDGSRSECSSRPDSRAPARTRSPRTLSAQASSSATSWPMARRAPSRSLRTVRSTCRPPTDTRMAPPRRAESLAREYSSLSSP